MLLDARSFPRPPSHDRFCVTYNPQSMPSVRPLPQELIDKIIDEIGDYCRDYNYKRCGFVGVERGALHACALVSKNWTGRSRVQLFKEVTAGIGDSSSYPIPPGTIMPFITKLKLQLCNISPFPDFLTPFHACPIMHLGITEGTLATMRDYLVEFATVISVTLQTVTFTKCSLPLSLIHDIVLAHPDLKQLNLCSSEIEATKLDRPTTSHLGTPHSVNLELGVFFSEFHVEARISSIAAIAQLPIKFRRLNFSYIQCLAMIPPANALIEANAKSLSSLTVSFFMRASKVLCQKSFSSLTIQPYGSIFLRD